MRTIKVINPQEGITYEFTGEFNTLGDLLDKMDEKGIDYSGIRMVEGYSKSSFNTSVRDAVIPQEVTLRGTTYTNLIFSMMQEDKKIPSAVDRKDIMRAAKTIIEENPNLKKEIGNISQVKTEVLERFVDKYSPCSCSKNCEDNVEISLNDWANQIESRLKVIEEELGISYSFSQEDFKKKEGISPEDNKLFEGLI